MEEKNSRADAALLLMRQWWWPGDPTRPFAGQMNLREAVNRLAMDGQADPEGAILALLCRGDLRSRGDFHWQKYQWGSEYQLQETGVIISERRWQDLANLIADENRMFEADEWPNRRIDLEKLGLKDSASYEWEFGQCRFSTARCPPDTSIFDGEYFEEWFSAWEICIWPEFIREEQSELESDDEPERVETQPNKGGRPPAADWELAALELAGRYYRGDFKPQTIADVGRELASWLGDQNLHPSDSVVRIHAKRIFDAFRAWEHD
jgi:hypothetical protein